MRILRWLLFALLVPVAASAQILAPQINLSGNIGCQGFPCVNTGTLVFTSDANHAMTVTETSAFNIKVTSSVSLTATRNLVAPTGRFPFTIENATTGGQSIQIIGASGTGVTIPNGATVAVWNDGTNYVQIGITGSGTVTNFAAPSGSWPYWLVPMVTNSTSTPSLTVSASAIPTGALAFPSTTVNGQTCTLGSTCTIPGFHTSTRITLGSISLAPQQSEGYGVSIIAGYTSATPFTCSFVGVNTDFPNPTTLISCTVVYRTDDSSIVVLVNNSSTTATWTTTDVSLVVAGWY
jgi:hypothetical protein